MRLIPVLDVLHNVAVRGVGGRRDEYRPLVTQLCAGSDPLDVAAGYRERLQTTTLYLADLDAIVHQRPNIALYEQLLHRGTDLWLDAGVRTLDDVTTLANLGVPTIIVGLESWVSPEALSEVALSLRDRIAEQNSARSVQRLSCRGATGLRERLLFSLDLRQGQSCGNSQWPTDPLAIIEIVLAAGINRFLVLDLHDVGQHTGGSTAELCSALRERSPDAEIITGGGVRDEADICRWEDVGVDGLLIASAVHEGRVPSAEWLGSGVFVRPQKPVD